MKRKNLSISAKVIAQTDIERLLQFFYTLHKDLNNSIFSATFFCQNDEEYEEKNINPNLYINLLDTKRIKKIVLFVVDGTFKARLSLEHGNPDSFRNSNYYEVESESEEKVDSTIAKLQNIFEAIKPQNLTYYRLNNLLSLFFGINIAALLLFSGLFNIQKDWAIAQIITMVIIFGFIWLMAAAFMHDFIRHYLKKTFPSVEFDFGPEHMRISRQNRAQSAIIISILLFLWNIFSVFIP